MIAGNARRAPASCYCLPTARTAVPNSMTDTLPITEPRRAPMRVLSHVGGSV